MILVRCYLSTVHTRILCNELAHSFTSPVCHVTSRICPLKLCGLAVVCRTVLLDAGLEEMLVAAAVPVRALVSAILVVVVVTGFTVVVVSGS